MLIFRYWESGNEIIVRVGEPWGNGGTRVAGSFVVSKDNWEEFKNNIGDREKCEVHFKFLEKPMGL